ncbi:MAG: molybdopterin synthase catalytic subunit MoaE [Pseudomonadales bacterium]
MSVKVCEDDFDVGHETAVLQHAKPDVGAVVNFVGYVRNINDGETVSALELEHYPAMTEKSISDIAIQAREKWDLLGIQIIHRVGRLAPEDQIVYVGVASKHRLEAFTACEFIMDYLKTQAPFWKKESTPNGDRWVDAREKDNTALARWD